MMVARSCAVGWEGNRRSGVATATRHRLCGISNCGLNRLKKGDELRYSCKEYDTLNLFTENRRPL